MQKQFRCLLARTKQSHLDSTFAPVYRNMLIWIPIHVHIIDRCTQLACVSQFPLAGKRARRLHTSSFGFKKADVKQHQQICEVIIKYDVVPSAGL